jgi:hypothetical protein
MFFLEQPEVFISDLLRKIASGKPPLPLLRSGIKRKIHTAMGDSLLASNFNYNTISKLSGTYFEGAGSIFEHLQFDGRAKVLKFFRFLTICVLYSSLDTPTTLDHVGK